MKNRKLAFTIMVVLIIALVVTGCRPAPRPVPQQDQERLMDRERPGEVRTPEENRDLTARADQIANEVVKLREVESATVIITGNTALIGVDLTDETRRQLNTESKRRIEDVVKRTDPDITRVSVTADPDLYKRIQNIAREIERGRPVSGFGQELEELVRRMTPGA